MRMKLLYYNCTFALFIFRLHIPTLRHMCYEDRLKALDLPSLAYRRLRGDAIETYKYLHSFYTLDSNMLLPLNQCTSLSTRGHCLKLMKRDCKSSVRTMSLVFELLISGIIYLSML